MLPDPFGLSVIGLTTVVSSHDRIYNKGGGTPIESIVTTATAGQNLDRLFSAVGPLTALIFGL